MSEVKIYRPSQLDGEEWRNLQEIERDAFASAFDRDQTEIDSLVNWDNPTQYMTSHIDPNTEVGGRYNPNQSYSQPRVAVAIENSEPIGFIYSAHNVSGVTERDRLINVSL